MCSALEDDWPLVFHCVNELQEALSHVPFPEAAHDASPAPAMPVEGNSDTAEKASDPQAEEHNGWIECDDCNKWRALPIEVVARGKVSGLVALTCEHLAAHLEERLILS